MRIVFFGATDLGYRCCEALIEAGEQVVGIISIPRDFRISYSATPVHNVTFRAFDDLATSHGIPLLYVGSSMADPAVRETLAGWRPDFGLAVGWYYMIPPGIRRLFARGVTGIHASLLPRYRGGAPLVWAMINGETRTGVTLFYFEDGVDTGDIVAQAELEIGRDDTIATLYDRAADAAVELVRTHVPLIRNGSAPRRAQDHAQATLFPQRKPEDGLIDWTRTPEEIRNFIRAQTRPYPGAFTIIDGKKVVIWDADVVEAPAGGEDGPAAGGEASDASGPRP